MKAKKGFTLVELLVVIAILAILATVSVVSYMSFIEAANRSADEQAVVQMNKVLEGNKVLGDVPKNATELRDMLRAAGYDIRNLNTMYSNYRFYWDSEKNLIILVNTSTNEGEYPDGAEAYVQGNTRWIPLDGIPEAIVTVKTGDELNVHFENDEDEKSTLQFGGVVWSSTNDVKFDGRLVYNAVDTPEMLDDSTYDTYYADFKITFSKVLTYKLGESAAGGKVGFLAAGSYSNHEGGKWVPLAVHAGSGTNDGNTQTVYLMNDVWNDVRYSSYGFIATVVKTFECGFKAIYDNNFASGTQINPNEQNMDDADKTFLDGLQVSVELVLREGYDGENYTGEEIVVHTYTITYHVDDDYNITITRE